jgi:hypothetical protein
VASQFGTPTPLPPARGATPEEALSRVREILEVWQGSRGDGLDRIVTVRDLLNAAAITYEAAASIYEAADQAVPDAIPTVAPSSAVPPPPEDLFASGAVGVIVLDWAFDDAYTRLQHFEVWRSPTTLLVDAVLIGTPTRTVFIDAIGEGSGYYWVRAVSDGGVSPFNAVAGTFGETAVAGSGSIQDGAITNPKLAANATGTSNIQDDAVTQDKLADNAVGAPQLQDGVVATPKLADGAVTYAKMQDVSATSRVIGRRTAGAGDPEEVTLSQLLDFVGSAANGDILVRSGGAWVRLPIGSAANVLTVSAGLPAWVAPTSGGPITELANVTLAANGTSLSTGTFTAKNFLAVHIWVPGYSSSDTASLQFNTAAGTAYRYHWTHIASGAAVLTAGLRAVSTDRIKIASANITGSRNATAFIRNFSAINEKTVRFAEVSGTGSAATHPTTDFGHGAWVSGAATQITRIDLVSSSNMLAGAKLVVHGWD